MKCTPCQLKDFPCALLLLLLRVPFVDPEKRKRTLSWQIYVVIDSSSSGNSSSRSALEGVLEKLIRDFMSLVGAEHTVQEQTSAVRRSSTVAANLTSATLCITAAAAAAAAEPERETPSGFSCSNLITSQKSNEAAARCSALTS
eukprot:5470-Heterococcus_DN1.PRE.1